MDCGIVIRKRWFIALNLSRRLHYNELNEKEPDFFVLGDLCVDRLHAHSPTTSTRHTGCADCSHVAWCSTTSRSSPRVFSFHPSSAGDQYKTTLKGDAGWREGRGWGGVGWGRGVEECIFLGGNGVAVVVTGPA